MKRYTPADMGNDYDDVPVLFGDTLRTLGADGVLRKIDKLHQQGKPFDRKQIYQLLTPFLHKGHGRGRARNRSRTKAHRVLMKLGGQSIPTDDQEDDQEDNQEWPVENIKAWRCNSHNQVELLVVWEGDHEEKETWEPFKMNKDGKLLHSFVADHPTLVHLLQQQQQQQPNEQKQEAIAQEQENKEDQKDDQKEDQREKATCPICWEDRSAHPVTANPCLDPWAASAGTCPECRTVLFE